MHPDTRSLACFVQPGMEGEKVYLKIYPPKKEAQVMFVWICQAEDKQRASQQFFKLQAAMKVLGISGDEQRALWLILGAIYHLGAAGTTKGKIAWMHNCIIYWRWRLFCCYRTGSSDKAKCCFWFVHTMKNNYGEITFVSPNSFCNTL